MRLKSGVPVDSTRSPSAGRAIHWALDAALVALVAMVLLGVVLGRVVPIMGDRTYMISSGSMTPAIPVGAAVVVDPQAHDIRVGDVISVHLTGSNVYTHRVTAVVTRNGQTWFVTKGDANKDADPAAVPASSVIGRVTLAIPFAGYLLRLLSLPSGVALLLGLGAMLLVASWLVESADDRTTAHETREPASPDSYPLAVGLAGATQAREGAAADAASVSSS